MTSRVTRIDCLSSVLQRAKILTEISPGAPGSRKTNGAMASDQGRCPEAARRVAMAAELGGLELPAVREVRAISSGSIGSAAPPERRRCRNAKRKAENRSGSGVAGLGHRRLT